MVDRAWFSQDVKNPVYDNLLAGIRFVVPAF